MNMIPFTYKERTCHFCGQELRFAYFMRLKDEKKKRYICPKCVRLHMKELDWT